MSLHQALQGGPRGSPGILNASLGSMIPYRTVDGAGAPWASHGAPGDPGEGGVTRLYGDKEVINIDFK